MATSIIPSEASSSHPRQIPRPIPLTAPMIPERYASLLAPTSPTAPEHKRANLIFLPSTMIQLCGTTSSVPDILKFKLQQCRTELDYFRCYQDSLRQALVEKKPLSEKDYLDEMVAVDRRCRPLVEEFRILTRQQRAMEQDLEDELAPKRRGGIKADTEADEADTDDDQQLQALSLLERGYAAALHSKSLSDEITGRHVDLRLAKFRRDVLAYHAASRLEGGEYQMYCHVTGWWEAGSVKVTHLVPRGMRGDELAYLFGDSEVAVEDRKNGITLHAKIEEAMDAGAIAIVPNMPAEKAATPTEWRCVLAKESYRDRIFSRDLTGHASRWNELDGKPLAFLTSSNRPATRFLFFRFIMTYLQAKIQGNVEWTEKIETTNACDLWPLSGPGGYLEKDTLRSITRNISGFELPASLYEELTFDGENPAMDPDYDTVLSMRLREVLISGMKGLGIRNNEKFGEELRLVDGVGELERGTE
ncbi:hypothetical protein EMPG_13952 [Blastomyces silverae]|uniref:HNH nuclease domain-containing protein n=1 Tax=Blastomyces silverae TaxID=2060906 RepID=A0A0H1BHT0_9EURO|nr:hypothetical protein EMPG_13952 [Blastomyces silverae]